jgi:hypothetical protein
MRNNGIPHLLKPLMTVSLVVAVAGLYWQGAMVQLVHVNTDMQSTDQSAYMNYAREMYDSDYAIIGGRNRMPLYPFLQSLFYRPNMTDEAFFIRGKQVNLVLSVCLLAVLAFIFRKFLSGLQSLNLMLIVAFTLFIFKAAYLQAELLFYFLNFCLFLLLVRFLQKPSMRLAILTGIVAGLAHLTKASILPGLALFVGLAGARWTCSTFFLKRYSLRDAKFIKSACSDLFAIFLVGMFFLITVFPYINNSKRVFGHYFYNVNSTFYIWYDSWAEVEQGTKAHGDRVGWPDMPPKEIPSMSKYLREHTLQQIIDRFLGGGRTVMINVVQSYGYFKYIMIYLCFLIAISLGCWRRVREMAMSNPFLCLFLILYFASYFLFYAWYAPIADGNRLILAQFIPLMFTISYALQTLLRSPEVESAERSIVQRGAVAALFRGRGVANIGTLCGRSGQKIASAGLAVRGGAADILLVFNIAVLLLVVVDIYFVLTERVGTMYSGS